MSTRKLLAAIMILAGLALGYLGYTTITENSGSLEIGDLEVGFSDQSETQKGYLYVGLAILLAGGGIYTLSKK